MDFNDFLHGLRTKALENVTIQAKRILHVGAAGLWYYEWFQNHYPFSGAKHVGVDLNPRPQGLPEEIEWFQRDVSSLDFAEDASFDMVFAGQFIEHISHEAQAKFFAEVNRILIRGGYSCSTVRMHELPGSMDGTSRSMSMN